MHLPKTKISRIKLGVYNGILDWKKKTSTNVEIVWLEGKALSQSDCIKKWPTVYRMLYTLRTCMNCVAEKWQEPWKLKDELEEKTGERELGIRRLLLKSRLQVITECTEKVYRNRKHKWNLKEIMKKESLYYGNFLDSQISNNSNTLNLKEVKLTLKRKVWKVLIWIDEDRRENR